MLALACDFRVMTSGKGLMSMNEVRLPFPLLLPSPFRGDARSRPQLTFGSPLPNSFARFFRMRIPPSALRDLGMAKRFAQAELLQLGLVDAVVPPAEVQARALELAEREGQKAAGGSWGAIKQQLWYPVMLASEEDREIVFPSEEGRRFWERMKAKGVTPEGVRAKL